LRLVSNKVHTGILGGNRDEALRFAIQWIDAWSKRDVAKVLSVYVEDEKFASPKAQSFIEKPVVGGKARLSQYWSFAISKIRSLVFTLDRIVWDDEAHELAVLYEANLNAVRTRACDLMKFDDTGRQMSGEALYGAAL
jgi:hypothetical protein